MNKKEVRTRFAPSPTGHLHVGGARTALFNFLYAKAEQGSFILRIEDTDQERSDQKSCDEMIESMHWLNLEWDEGYEKGGEKGPYRQSERLSIYQKYVDILLKEKKAYHCFCSQNELENKKKRREVMGLPPVYDGKCRNILPREVEQKLNAKQPHTIRFRNPNEKEIQVKDVIQGDVYFDSSLIEDFIILKSDLFPSYNFAVVIDDFLMEISHVIRGVGHLSNTPRQVLIYKAFGWQEPVWAHASEIVGGDHKKLSKRHGAVSVTFFRELGYPAHALINYMSLLGWSPQDGVEQMSLRRIIPQFDITKCSKSPAMFDVFDIPRLKEANQGILTEKDLRNALLEKSKLNWISNKTIQEKTDDEYLSEVMFFVKRGGTVPDAELESPELKEILLALKIYLNYYSQVSGLLKDFYFEGEIEFTAQARKFLRSDFAPSLIEKFKQNLSLLSIWEEATIKKTILKTGEELGIKGKDLFMSIRSAVTGLTEGIELPTYIKFLGIKKVIKRLEQAERVCA